MTNNAALVDATVSASSPIALMGGVVLMILVVATTITYLLEQWKPGLNLREVWTKIRSWWFMAPIFFFCVALDPRSGVALVGVICYMSLKEYFTLVQTVQADRGALFWSYLTIPIQFYWIATGWYAMFSIFIPVYLMLFIPVRQVLEGETTEFVARTGRIYWGLLYFVYGLSHMAYMIQLGPGGRELLLWLVFLTQINDVCAFCWGKTFGRNKIAPKISPNKTWEGFLGGIFSTGMLAMFTSFMTPFTLKAAFCTGVALGVAGFLGDLTVAAIKRDAGVKDASDFIPGHGGVLDRVNSLTFTAPLFFHYVRYFYF